MRLCTAEGVRISIQSPIKSFKTCNINPKSMVMAYFAYQKFSFNQLSHRKTMNDKIQPPFMTFNVSNGIAKNINKSGITLLSRSLITLNEVFDKRNQFGMSNCEQIFKTVSK